MKIKKRVKSDLAFKKVYQLWYNMKQRCLNPKNPYYKYYGGKGIKVSKRWETLDNFIQDIDNIKGFDLNKFLAGELFLDKDTENLNGDIYSLESCEFVTFKKSNKIKPHQQSWFEAISPNGEKHRAYNQSEFANKFNLRQSSISECLSGKLQTHKKWTFKNIN